jgi:hypothetical protein
MVSRRSIRTGNSAATLLDVWEIVGNPFMHGGSESFEQLSDHSRASSIPHEFRTGVR